MTYEDPVDCTWEAFIGDAYGNRYAINLFVPGTAEEVKLLEDLGTIMWLWRQGRVSLPLDPNTAEVIKQPRLDYDIDRALKFLEKDLQSS